MAVVELRDVYKTFEASSRKGAPTEVIRGVDLAVESGQIVAVVGYSGAGKSTLVRLINALEPVTSGSVVVNGQDITKMSERQLQSVRHGIGMIFQQFNLLSSRTVWGNVAYPLQVIGASRDRQAKRVSDLLHFVGLADKAHAHIEQLSGGQKQRVGIARALATEPTILLADEATSALDPDTTSEVLQLLQRVNRELGVTIVLITHEMDVVRHIADQVAVLDDGRIVESGPVVDIFSKPRHPVTKRFISTVVDAAPSPDRISTIRDQHPGRLVTIEVREEGARQSDIFAEIINRGVSFELVHGGIETVRGASFGNLTLALQGETGAVDSAIEAIGRLAPVQELV